MFQGIEHTAISSPDPQKLAQWYVDHLDFHINFTYAGNYFVKAANGTMLKDKGVTFVGEPFETMGNRLVFFNDLDGNLLHLIQRETPLP